MTKLYDEGVSRELCVQRPSERDYVDLFYLRVRLFKLVAEDQRNAAAPLERWAVYLQVQDYVSYVGEPGPDRPKCHTRRRVYSTGPDSARIRQAIAIIDGFKAQEKPDGDSHD